jgi:hypothetical protein
MSESGANPHSEISYIESVTIYAFHFSFAYTSSVQKYVGSLQLSHYNISKLILAN